MSGGGEHGLYLVTGRREYRGHAPGTQFEALIHPAVEQRALSRGDIKLVKRVSPALEPGSHQVGKWPPPSSVPVAATEAPEGASSIEGGGGQ